MKMIYILLGIIQIIASLVICVSLHEFIHVIQYYFIYGDNLLYIYTSINPDIGIAATTTAVYTPCSTPIDFLSETEKWLFYEIPAYTISSIISAFLTIGYILKVGN